MTSVAVGPCATGDSGAIEPSNLKLFEVVPRHGAFERDTIKRSMAYQNRSAQTTP